MLLRAGSPRSNSARAPADKLRHLIIHDSEAQAEAAGFGPREGGKKVRAV